MPFDTSGVFNRVIEGGWQADAAAGTKITAVRHDAEDDGFAAGLSDCINKWGYTQPQAHLPMNNKKITNLGEPSDPSDAATRNYVDTFKAFTTGLNVSGAGPINGFINFTSPTGINGIGWTTADMSWVGKLAEAAKYSKRLAINNAKDGTGSDVVFFDESGRMQNAGVIMQNVSYDGAAWRTIAAGTGTYIAYSGGSVRFASNDTATTSAFQAYTPREYFRFVNATGSPQFHMAKSASGKTNQMLFYTGTELRWQMQMGDGVAESSTRVGSRLVLSSYDNSGANAVTELLIDRSTHLATFGGGITAAGTITSGNNFDSTSTTCIVSATSGGAIYLRPDGPSVATSGMKVDTNGNVLLCEGASASTGGLYAGNGVRGRVGSNGSYQSNFINHYWDGTYLKVYSGTSAGYLGAVAWQCDYRIKRDVEPLPSMWDAIKLLNPISYKQKAFRDTWVDNDLIRFGFVAHELQERLGQGAATGEKDGEEIQSPNLLGLISALTKALQEAMGRIEALEAAHAH